ncbi:hypothetical protein BASA81_015800 [Batrachochytrium salamandrivorans]|nr:hypothetical protein BASA81_015800 [Batrachochytrium salamandrivorans]
MRVFQEQATLGKYPDEQRRQYIRPSNDYYYEPHGHSLCQPTLTQTDLKDEEFPKLELQMGLDPSTTLRNINSDARPIWMHTHPFGLFSTERDQNNTDTQLVQQ